MSSVLQALELGALGVCRGDWRNHITDELKEGMCVCRYDIEGDLRMMLFRLGEV